jgi:hypothetical protein
MNDRKEKLRAFSILAIVSLALVLPGAGLATSPNSLLHDDFEFRDESIWDFNTNSSGAGYTFIDSVININGGSTYGGGAVMTSHEEFIQNVGEDYLVFETYLKMDERAYLEDNFGAWGFISFTCNTSNVGVNFQAYPEGHPFTPLGGLIAMLDVAGPANSNFVALPDVDLTAWHTYRIEYYGDFGEYYVDDQLVATLSQAEYECPLKALVSQGSAGHPLVTQADYATVSSYPLDSDDDGIPDDADLCPDTQVPEGIPTIELKPNRWALVDDDHSFDTAAKGKGTGPRKSYTLTDTAGCSGEQIIGRLELGLGHSKFGVSSGAMDEWVEFANSFG